MEEHGRSPKQIEEYSETYRNRKLKFLGHVIRADDSDPMKQVALRDGSIKGTKIGKRRVGKPKLDWIQEGKRALGEHSAAKSTNLNAGA